MDKNWNRRKKIICLNERQCVSTRAFSFANNVFATLTSACRECDKEYHDIVGKFQNLHGCCFCLVFACKMIRMVMRRIMRGWWWNRLILPMQQCDWIWLWWCHNFSEMMVVHCSWCTHLYGSEPRDSMLLNANPSCLLYIFLSHRNHSRHAKTFH